MSHSNLLPQLFVLVVVVRMDEVEIKSTNVGFDFDNTVITPVVLAIPNAMSVGARITLVIPTRLKLRIVQGVNVRNVTEVGSVLYT
jgi:hypothetical protein